MSHPPTKPYDTDAEYLSALLQTVTTRCRYLSARADQDASDGTAPPDDLPREAFCLSAQLEVQKATLEARIQATYDAGGTIAVVDLCRAHDLSDLEMIILHLATVTAFGVDLREHLPFQGVRYGYGLTVEMVASYADIPPVLGLIKLRKVLASKEKLVKDGLVTVEPWALPEDFMDTRISLTRTAFDRIAGLAVPDPKCPTCGCITRETRR